MKKGIAFELSIDTRKSFTNVKNSPKTNYNKLRSNFDFRKFYNTTWIKGKTHNAKIFAQEPQSEISFPIQIKRYSQEKMNTSRSNKQRDNKDDTKQRSIFKSLKHQKEFSNLKTNNNTILPQLLINNRLFINQSYTNEDNFKYIHLHRTINIRKLKTSIKGSLSPYKSINNVFKSKLNGRNHFHTNRTSLDNGKLQKIELNKSLNLSKHFFKENDISIQKASEKIKLLLYRNGRINFQPSLLKNFKKNQALSHLIQNVFSRKACDLYDGFFVKAKHVKLNVKLLNPKFSKIYAKIYTESSSFEKIKYYKTRKIRKKSQDSMNNSNSETLKTLSHLIKKKEIIQDHLFREDDGGYIKNELKSNKLFNSDIIY